MNTTHQQTLAQSIKFSGIGLHSGAKISGTLHPAPPDTGITFFIKLKNTKAVSIKAHYRNIGALSYNTGLKAQGIELLTVEHLLSAFHGFNIDNAIVELDNREVPIMDGSSAPFVYLLSEAGFCIQNAPRRTLCLTSSVRVSHDNAWIVANPSQGQRLSMEYLIDFNHPSIGRMKYQFSQNPLNYSTAIAPARTFGFLKEVEYLRCMGLIRGASMHNAVVLDDRKIISGRLRFPDEFVRHKILDFWGDITLLGRPLVAKIKAYKAGHYLHAKLVEKLVNTPGLLQPLEERIPHRILNWKPKLVDDAIVGVRTS